MDTKEILEIIKHGGVGYYPEEFDEAFYKAENSLKAVDIIKLMPKEMFHVGFVVNRDETLNYFIYCGDKKFAIDKDSYDILKEILKNE